MKHEFKKVPCPKCGKEFDPRGIGAHMRFAHGKVRKFAASRKNEPDSSARRVYRRRRKQKGLVGLLGQMRGHIENVEAAMRFFNGDIGQ